MKHQSVTNENPGPGIRSLQQWCRGLGITPMTAWRWRRDGWLETVNIAGRQYVTDEASAKFHQRATAGEFSKTHQTPLRRSRRLESVLP